GQEDVDVEDPLLDLRESLRLLVRVLPERLGDGDVTAGDLDFHFRFIPPAQNRRSTKGIAEDDPRRASPGPPGAAPPGSLEKGGENLCRASDRVKATRRSGRSRCDDHVPNRSRSAFRAGSAEIARIFEMVVSTS